MTKAKNTEKSRSMFKIKTEDVRKAAKKANLRIEDQGYYGINLEGEVICGCPLGCLFASTHNVKDRDNDAIAASKWASKKFGQHYKRGFVDAFDGHGLEKEIHFKNKKSYNQYILGYNNGKLLRRTLLKK